ncbi:hypothetical protein A3C96_02595 [Candidatus Uhrbacteria bacterium RIFCSPHIGHO2_02_FULL_60_10]|uniref:ABC transporter substrate-binding protein n=1 Tax=Candidatus Uhrbacteria bacterium RIFCSPHIGHO2_02_FULL_60_10 TaxID=1802392 RepID=A0A1F7U2V9_9BACT|nr:MAG: hypothetical protein A3C96_02595 [Candidatus Uhrbacteria bacterium RIFCSPHIGHO2_02_FULL_60_10]
MRRPLLAFIAAALLLSGAGCPLLQTPVKIVPKTLNYWRSADQPGALSDVITAYEKLHPNVKIVTKYVPPEDFDRLILEALAEDRGPDLFSIPNYALRSYQGKLMPMPAEVQVPTLTVDKNKKVVAVNQKTTLPTLRVVTNDYVEAVLDDIRFWWASDNPEIKSSDRFWGLPLGLGNLALFYNRTLLKKAALEKPATSWSEFSEQAAKLTTFDNEGNISQSGAAIGKPNARYSADLLLAIAAQYGAEISSDYGPTFHVKPPNYSGEEQPMLPALRFVRSFADRNTTNYSWNESMPDSLVAFAAEKTAFYLGFPEDTRLVAERSPKLDLGLAPLPQVNPQRPVNIAKYHVEVVSARTAHPNEAWDFINFAAQADHVRSYLAATNRPAALRSLLNEQLTNQLAGPFASQALVSQSWYHGQDYAAADRAVAELLINEPPFDAPDNWIPVVNQAAGTVTDTWSK